MQPDFVGKILNTFLIRFWPLILLAVIIYVVGELAPVLFSAWKRKNKFIKGEQWRSGRELILWLQKLSPTEFEQYVAHLFSNLGYKTEVVGGAYDGGIDVIAEKDGVKHYVQCKKFIIRQVPVGAVRDFYGAMADRGAEAKGIFITTNTFTLEAEKFAENIPVELIDGSKLAKYIEMAKMDILHPVVNEAKVCPVCGSGVVERSGKFGKFYGCSQYPNCKGTLKFIDT